MAEVILQNPNWLVTCEGGGGWIVGQTRWGRPVGDHWIHYGNGRLGFDYPELIPKYIKGAIRKFVTREVFP